MTGSGDSFTSSVVAGGGGGAITVFAGVAPELLFEATLDSVGLGKLVEAVAFGALVGCGLGVATNADAFVAELLPGGWVFETVCDAATGGGTRGGFSSNSSSRAASCTASAFGGTGLIAR